MDASSWPAIFADRKHSQPPSASAKGRGRRSRIYPPSPALPGFRAPFLPQCRACACLLSRSLDNLVHEGRQRAQLRPSEVAWFFYSFKFSTRNTFTPSPRSSFQAQFPQRQQYTWRSGVLVCITEGNLAHVCVMWILASGFGRSRVIDCCFRRKVSSWKTVACSSAPGLGVFRPLLLLPGFFFSSCRAQQQQRRGVSASIWSRRLG